MKKIKVKFNIEIVGNSTDSFELTFPDFYNPEEFCEEAILDWVYEKVKTNYEIINEDSESNS